MTFPRDPHDPLYDMESGMEQDYTLEMAGKLGKYAREREAQLVRTFWWLLLVLVVLIIIQAVFE